jgi:hypothetical protein
LRNIGATCFLIVAFASAGARAEDLSYHGWSGSADYSNNHFIGCHLDSPPAISDANDRIRVVAEDTGRFFIEFATRFENPQPAPGRTTAVELGLVNGEDVFSGWSSNGYTYPTRVLSSGQAPDGKPFSRILLAINTGDEMISRLKDAKRLKVFWPTTVQNFPDLNFSIFELRHRLLSDPSTWLGVLDTNDTYGAIQTVIACVRANSGVAGTPSAAVTRPSLPPSAFASMPSWQPPLPPAVARRPIWEDATPPGLETTDAPPLSAGERDCPGGSCSKLGPIHDP